MAMETEGNPGEPCMFLSTLPSKYNCSINLQVCMQLSKLHGEGACSCLRLRRMEDASAGPVAVCAATPTMVYTMYAEVLAAHQVLLAKRVLMPPERST